MASKSFSVCEVYAPEKDSFEVLKEYLKKFPVHISNTLPTDIPCESDDTPIQIVGWGNLKEFFPKHNIFDKSVNDKVCWTHTHAENKDEFFDDVKSFVTKSVMEWLPDSHKEYDAFIEGDLEGFLKKEIDPLHPIYIYYNKGALYLRNLESDYIINVESLKYYTDDYKSFLTRIFSKYTLLPFSYLNVDPVLDIESLAMVTIENVFWIKNGAELDERTYFNVVPGMDYHKYVPFFLSLIADLDLDEEQRSFLKRMQEKDRITTWISNQDVCFHNTFEHDSISFKTRDNKKFAKFNYSNKRTITGRIVAKDSFNIQNLPKDSPIRSSIISRFRNGRILVCDYTSFETRISMHLSGNKEFIQEFNDKDIHYELGKAMFQRDVITNGERSSAKGLSHAMLYGASHKRLVDMLSSQMADPELGLYYAKQMMGPIIDFSEKLIKEVKVSQKIKTHKGSIIYPDKEYAAFNNLIQSTAAEIMTDKLFEIRELLKSMKSKFMFQIHDSLIFDIHPTEQNLVEEILKTLSKLKSTSFALGYRIGRNYAELGEKKFYSYSK